MSSAARSDTSPLVGEGGERSEPGEGSLVKSLQKVSQYALRILQDVIVPISNDPKPFSDQSRITRFVRLRLTVLAAINFDYELSLEADKIENVWSKRNLSSKFCFV